MVSEVLIFVAAIIVIYFFKDLITILCILSVLLIAYMYFSGNSNTISNILNY